MSNFIEMPITQESSYTAELQQISSLQEGVQSGKTLEELQEIYKKIDAILSDILPHVINDPQIQNQDDMVDFFSKILGTLEDFYTKEMKETFGINIKLPKLVLYDDIATHSGCQVITRDKGPQYCFQDKKIYLHLLEFIKLLAEKQIEGDMPLAFVLQHEFGHDIQGEIHKHFKKFLKVIGEINGVKYNKKELKKALSWLSYQGDNPKLILLRNTLTIILEKWADYLTGVHTRYLEDIGVLEEGDIEESIRFAYSIGSDFNNKVPDPTKTSHGTSEERVKSFLLGYKNGTIYNSPLSELLNHFILDNLDTV